MRLFSPACFAWQTCKCTLIAASVTDTEAAIMQANTTNIIMLYRRPQASSYCSA